MKEIIGDATIYRGDAIELMPSIKADLIVADPPYLLTSGGATTGNFGGCFDTDNYRNDGKIIECNVDWKDFMPLFYQSLNDDSHCYVMCNNRHVGNMLSSAKDVGFGFHNLLVWDKISPTPNRWYMKNLEFIGFFYKGKAKYINNCGSKQLIKCQQVDQSDHPTEKPVSLMQHYIENSSNIGDVVFDPFCGSGTTGVASIKSNRKFIGIEITQKWFDVTCRRIEKETKQNELFNR